MSCGTLSDGFKQNKCATSPGAEQTIYFGLFDDVVAFTNGTTTGEKDGIAFKAGKGLYKWQVERDSVITRHTTPEEDGGGVNVTHETSFKLVDTSLEARDAVNDLLGKDVFTLTLTKSNTIVITGADNGARVSVANGSTESADLGHQVTVRALNQNKLPYHMNNGSGYASTIAYLETLVVGS